MRADFAPFAVDLLLAFAGLGILMAIRIVPASAPAMAAAFGLAYLTGAAVVPILLIALLVVGVPLALELFVIVALLCMSVGVFRSQPRPADRASPGEGWWHRPWRSWPADAWVAGACLVLFGAFAVVGMLSAFQMPLVEWDAWSIWARKAQMLTVHDSLDSEFWTGSSYSWIHLDYPLQFPVWEALHFRAAGGFETQLLLRHVWLLLVAFVWAAAYLFREQVRPLVWAPLLLLAAAAPGVWEQLLTGYADVPMAIFACLGAISLALWLSREDGRLLALAAVMLAGAASVKNEGLMAAAALLLVAGAIALARGFDLRRFGLAAGVVVVAILPWRIWIAAQGIEGDLPVSKSITDPGYMLDRIDRVWPANEAIASALAAQGTWLHLLPLAALAVAASLVSGVGRRVASFYLASFALTWAGLVWSYWISPNPLDWHIATSGSRVITVLMFICLAAVVHLSGLLLGGLLQRQRRIGSDLGLDPAASLEAAVRSD